MRRAGAESLNPSHDHSSNVTECTLRYGRMVAP